MPQSIPGPLYFETSGRGGPLMAFIHPNPLDQSCWLYQMARFSTWFTCASLDIPGYGRSPAGSSSMSMTDIAQASLDTLKLNFGDREMILVGCSVGGSVVQLMANLQPDRIKALVMCGTSFNPNRAKSTQRRIDAYRTYGIGYRTPYVKDIFSPQFNTDPISGWFADLISERNGYADLDTIIRQFEALSMVDSEIDHGAISCPTLIISGSLDSSREGSFALQKKIPGAEFQTIEGAGHACQIERPREFDRHMIDFLTRHGLLSI